MKKNKLHYIRIRNFIFKFIPDKFYLKLIFYKTMKKKLNLKNPITFSEKIQWLKLYDRKEFYTDLVDKYAVRNYISETIGEEYLIPLIGVWDSFEEIDFSQLPNQFVLKCTHDSGGVVICKDKNEFNRIQAREKINKALKHNYYYDWREWPYKNIKPRIICEQLLIDGNCTDLKDYKFMCFNGKVKCILVCSDRSNPSGLKLDFYDRTWNKLPFRRPNYPNSEKNISKPQNLNKMIELAEYLSNSFSFIRVDFYEINGQIYFGELTFYPNSGFQGFFPEIYDEILGSWLDLPLSV